MTILQEGLLLFTFGPETQASKYDGWSFYRNQFKDRCFRDNKAVDMVCVTRDKAWLIEVKDYRQHRRTKPIELADEVAIKIRDTLAGLAASYYQAADPAERGLARDALRKQHLGVVCHLEQPTKYSRLRPRAIEPTVLQQKLRSLLKAVDPRLRVVDTHSIAATLPWTVTKALPDIPVQNTDQHLGPK